MGADGARPTSGRERYDSGYKGKKVGDESHTTRRHISEEMGCGDAVVRRSTPAAGA
jgi:deferrochelatase/peroxidase EfeB